MEHKNNNYLIYKKKIASHDLNMTLLIVHSLIKDILLKYCTNNEKTMYVEKIMTTHYDPFTIQDNDDLEIITHNNNPFFNNMPQPIRLSLYGTINIINTLNEELESLYKKINNHNNSYYKYVQVLDLDKEINIIYDNIIIFEKRIDTMLKILQLYDINKTQPNHS